MEKRKTKLEDLDGVFELLNELYENKIEYSEFAKKYKESLENSNLMVLSLFGIGTGVVILSTRNNKHN